MRKILTFAILLLGFSISLNQSNAQTNAPAGNLPSGYGIAASGEQAQQVGRAQGGKGLVVAQDRGKAALASGLGIAIAIVFGTGTGTGTTTTTSTTTK